MVVEGYRSGNIVALVTEKGRVYIYETEARSPDAGPLLSSKDQMAAFRNAIPLREALRRDEGKLNPAHLEDAIAGAIRTLWADSYEEVDA